MLLSLTSAPSYSLLHNKSTSKDVLKEGDPEHLKILKRIADLRSQIKQVEKDVYHPEGEILQTGESFLYSYK